VKKIVDLVAAKSYLCEGIILRHTVGGVSYKKSYGSKCFPKPEGFSPERSDVRRGALGGRNGEA